MLQWQVQKFWENFRLINFRMDLQIYDMHLLVRLTSSWICHQNWRRPDSLSALAFFRSLKVGTETVHYGRPVNESIET